MKRGRGKWKMEKEMCEAIIFLDEKDTRLVV